MEFVHIVRAGRQRETTTVMIERGKKQQNCKTATIYQFPQERDDLVWQIAIALTAIFDGGFRWFGRRYSMHAETEQGDQQHKFHC